MAYRLLGPAVVAVAACGAACADLVDDSPRLALTGRDPRDLFAESYARPTVPASVEDWQARADELASRLRAAADLVPPRPVPTATVLARRSFGAVLMEDLLLQGFGGTHLPAALYLPAGAAGKVPGVLVNVGHDARGQRAPYVRTLAWRLAEGGIAALTIDWWGMGSRFGADWRHIPIGLRSIVAGLHPVTPVLDEPWRALDYLASRPEVDPSRLGMAGQSGGGMVTMHLAALDERVAAAVVVDIVATNEYIFETLMSWGDPDGVVPGSLGLTSHGEILAMVAPRPLLVLSGDMDAISPTAVAGEALTTTRGVYDLLGAGTALAHQGFPTAHCYCDSKIQATLAFLGEHLVGSRIESSAEPPPGSEPTAAPPDGDVRWLDLIAARLMETPAPPTTEEDAAARLARVHAAIRTATGFTRRPVEQHGLVAVGDAPLVAILIADSGVDAAVSETLAERGGLGIVDLVPTGLGSIDASADSQRFLAQNSLAVGRPLLGLGVEDVVWAADQARADRALRVAAICDGPQAALACLAAAAAAPDAIDGLALAGLPTDFAAHFAFGEPDPTLYYVTMSLGSSTSPELLVAAAAPRLVAVVGAPAEAWSYAPAAFAALGQGDALDLTAADLATAAARVLDDLSLPAR